MQIYLEHRWENISAPEWNALAALAPTHTVFQTHQWHTAWLEQFQPELFLLCIKDQGRLLGVAPLAVVKKGQLRILKFIGTGHADYCDFIYDKKNTIVVAKIFEGLMDNKVRWDAMALDQIPEYSPTVAALPGVFTGIGLSARRYSRLPCPAIGLTKSITPLLNKKSMRRHYGHFQKQGEYRVLHLTEPAEIIPYLEEFFDQHIRRRQGERAKSLFLDEGNCQFYKNCVRYLGQERWVILTVLRSQGRNIAFHFGLGHGAVFMWYKPSFEPRLSRYSPGEVLLREVLTYAADNGFEELDFTVGDEAFKSRFADRRRFNVSFKVFKTKRDRCADQWISAAKGLLAR